MTTYEQRLITGLDEAVTALAAAQAEVGVLREALTALLAATEPCVNSFAASTFLLNGHDFRAARAAAAAVVERPQ